MTKRLLLTGATGMIGRHCLPRLLAQGFEVHAITSSGSLPIPEVRWHLRDLFEPGVTRSLLAAIRPTHLLHLAWFTAPGAFWVSPENTDWLHVSLELFRNFRRLGGQRLVGVGSCAEYDWSQCVCDERSTPRNPSTLYGQTKLALAEYLQALEMTGAVSTAWARLFFLYGPHASANRMPGVVISKLLLGEAVDCSQGTQRRDFLHVTDAADALCRLVDSDVTGVLNVCSGQAVPVRDLFEQSADLLRRRDLLRIGAMTSSASEPELIVGNNDRLRRELGWQPKFTLHDGLNDTVNWWRGHRKAA